MHRIAIGGAIEMMNAAPGERAREIEKIVWFARSEGYRGWLVTVTEECPTPANAIICMAHTFYRREVWDLCCAVRDAIDGSTLTNAEKEAVRIVLVCMERHYRFQRPNG